MLAAGAMLPWSGGAFQYVAARSGLNDSAAQVPAQPVVQVIDPIDLFTPQESVRLAEAVDAARARTGAQFVVMSTRGLRGEDFNRFADRFHAGWERTTGSNGAAIVFLSPADSLVGISTGNDLPIRPTAAQRQVIIESMKPLARSGDFEGAALTGMKGLEDLLARQGETGNAAVQGTT